MTQDKSKKTLRHFQCRDYLWDLFEQMSTELECSPDYLINEAMRQYARSRNYVTGATSKPRSYKPNSGAITSGWQTEPGAPVQPPRRASGAFTEPPPRPGDIMRSSVEDPRPSSRPPMLPSVAPAPPDAEFHEDFEGLSSVATNPPHAERFAAAPRQTARPSSASINAPARPRTSTAERSATPPPLDRVAPPEPRGEAMRQGGTLYVIYRGQRHAIDKEEFMIGRGARSADLSIKDGNISRRHAAVVFQNGDFYLQDLGSTNGVEYQGQRIESKRIENGDVFFLCDHELRFVYG